MLTNVGKKIKVIGEVYLALSIAAAVIGGFFIMFSGPGQFFYGLLTMCLGGLCAWASSLFILGFGTIVEKSEMELKALQANAENPILLQGESTYVPPVPPASEDSLRY